MASILDRVKAVFKQAQNTNINYNRALYNWLGESIIWNQENDDTYIRQGYQINATVYSIINKITDASVTIPLHVYKVENKTEAKNYKAMTSGTLDSAAIIKSMLVRQKAFTQLEDTHPLQKLLDRPNPTQSYSEWLTELISFGKLTGNRYIFGVGPDTGPNAGKYTELYVLPSQNMEIISGGIMQPVKSYKLIYNGTFETPAETICHIRDFNPNYDGTGAHLYGQSPLRAGLRSLTANNEALTTGVKYLQNQMGRGLLSSDDNSVTEIQAQQLKDKFKKQHQGSDKAGDIIITPAKLSWINFGLPASDLALIEQYNSTIKDLCNIYGVPVQLLNNTDSSSYNNMKEVKKSLYLNAVIPELIKVRDELNRWLAPQYGNDVFIDFDFTKISDLQEDMEKVVGQLKEAWWISPNEKREIMNFNKDESAIMDDYFVPANLMPLKNTDPLLDINTPNE